jgi:rhomboid protease GluP
VDSNRPELIRQTPAEPAPSKTVALAPTVTFTLIGLNALVFAVMVVKGVAFFDPTVDSVLKWGADYGPLTLRGQWWRMFLSMFIHFGIIHIAFNMIVLANIGPFMEALSGRVSYLVLYLVAGLGGGAASLAWHPWTVSAGASGAIFGLYGGLLAFLIRHKDTIPPDSLKSLTKGAMIFIGYNVLYGLARPEVDMAAHIGGLGAGFLFGLFLVQRPAQRGESQFGGRDMAGVVLGALLVLATLTLLPKPDDLRGEVLRIQDLNTAALSSFDNAQHQWSTKQITDQQYADIIEQQVLPKWKSEHDALAGMKRVPPRGAALVDALTKYMTLRESGWNELIEGLRTQNAKKIEEANQKSSQADLMAVKIGLKK